MRRRREDLQRVIDEREAEQPDDQAADRAEQDAVEHERAVS